MAENYRGVFTIYGRVTPVEKVDIKLDNELDKNAKEAFKKLRTNIVLNNDDTKVIAVTSSIPKEGKTNIAFNLARFMAKIDKKVLFVDADLRKSIFIEQYGIMDKISGLGSYLTAQKDYKDIIYNTNIDNLNIIFSELSYDNSPELLDSSYFKRLIPTLKKEYDYIFIDTPSLGNVIDGAIIVKECDGVILVIEENAVSRKLAYKVVEQLEMTGCKVLGIVLNKVRLFREESPGDDYYLKTI